jgi:large subunit ribosomal protein L23
MNAKFEIISGMVLSEKSNLLSELGKYTFRVSVSANKPEIKKAVEAFFGKKVLSVNTSNFTGKVRRKRTASEGSTASWKKAVVTLVAGERIELA